ncbi:hypothetical protein [Ferruginibacter sp.]
MNITTAEELKQAITELKQKRIEAEMELVYELDAYMGELKNTLVDISIGVGSGVLAKKILPFNKNNLLGKAAGLGIQGAITTTVINNADTIKAVGTAIWKNLFKRKEKV